MPEENVMDALNAALGDAVTAEPETPEPETLETEEPENLETEEPEGESKPEGEPEGEEKPEGEPEAEKGPNGERERNPDGTWKKVEKEAPKKDFVNDPVPENLKKDTSERMRGLIDIAKNVTAERDKIQTDFDYMVKGVQATGTSPEQYGETLSWLALFNSNDPKQQEKALELVETVAERLAVLLGKERTIGDPLAAHADLKDAVTKGQITAQYAKEIARTRNGQQFRTELTTQVKTQEQQRQAAAQELATARADLNALEETLQTTDPSYAAKKSILVQALKPVFASIPPSQWKGKFQEAYRNIKIGAPAARPAGVPKNQPLRAGKTPAGGQSRDPSNPMEVMNAALSGMNK